MAGFNHFPQLAAVLDVACKEANEEIAVAAVGHVQEHIVANGQVDTGYMLSSVHNEAQSDGSQNVVVGAYYGIYQNYGTRYLPPRPFWEPGLDDTQTDIDSALQGIVAKLQKAAGI